MSEPNSLDKKRETNWMSVIFNLHIYVSIIPCLQFLLYQTYLSTILFTFSLVLLGLLGVTAGSHRLWAHRTYKATKGLRIFLMLCQTLVGHGSIYDWVKLHRLHHKYFNTDMDPFNPSRGFFYSHVMANNSKLSQAQEQALQEIDMADIEQDGVVMFQHKYYVPLFLVVTLLLPMNAPAEYWGESILVSCFIAGWMRFILGLHLSWLIHSATQIWGLKPGENVSDSSALFFVTKTNWLAYHYMIPSDYQTSEYGKYGNDCTSKFIRVCAALEMATDLIVVDSKAIRDALDLYANGKLTLDECLAQVKNQNIPDSHYLTPNKYY